MLAHKSRQRKNRRTFHRRNPDPKGIDFRRGKRYDLILTTLYDYRALRRDQIQDICFTGQSTQRVNDILGRLFDHGYVIRRMSAREEGPGSSMPVYFLGRRAPRRIAAAADVDLAKIYWYSHHNAIKWGKINHTLRIGDTRIAIIRAATQAGYTISRSYNERTLSLKRLYNRAKIPKLPKRNKVPDWYGTLNLGGSTSSLALEVDMANESNHVFEQKVKAYIDWVQTGAYERMFDTTSLRIITATTSQRRLNNLKRTTEKLAGEHARMFLFTHFDLFLTRKKDILHDPIWERAGKNYCDPLIG